MLLQVVFEKLNESLFSRHSFNPLRNALDELLNTEKSYILDLEQIVQVGNYE